MIKIVHDRPGCIGCTLCAEQAPGQWEMDKDDGKSNLKCGKKEGEIFVVEIAESELAVYELAARDCPTKVIKVVKETGSFK